MAAADVAPFLNRHPWPAAWASQPRVEWLWHYEVPLPVETLWPFIADTSRMNRALGVAEMHFEDRGSERFGSATIAGVEHRWREVPWNWVAEQYIESLREYDAGLQRAQYGVFELTPLDSQHTRVSVYFGAVPRHLFGRALLTLGFPSLGDRFAETFRTLAEQLAALRPALAPPTAVDLSVEALERLHQTRDALVRKGLAAAVVDRLFEWLRTGDELDLVRIQVLERARAWGVDPRALLEVALHATRAGVLDISWDVVCPHCRNATAARAGPDALTPDARCAVCEIDFDTGGPDAVEITFRVNRAIRAIEQRTFCSAEPAHKAHIRVQLELGPGAVTQVRAPLAPGRWRLRMHGEKTYGSLDVAPGASAGAGLEWRAGERPSLHAAPAPTLTLRNDAERPQRFVVEAAQWHDHALRPATLFTLQTYRDLFSEDYLSADVQLAIGAQTILFTDIVGSTAMYAQRGDPAAFMEVKRHFAEVFPLVAQHKGAVVKTIGDAVMAAFSEPLDAVKCAAAIHQVFHRDRADSATRLRISMHAGPCIAVKLNAGIDYFGQTVNLAAKLQSLADAGDVAMSEAVFHGPGVEAWLARAAVEVTAYESVALPAPVPVRRWSCFA